MTELRDQLQQTLGDSYRLEQELGGGGMSRVFVAHEASLGRKVVVKVLPPEMAAAVSIDRFRREIQLAAQLQHPHIVPLLSAGETGGLPYFTMPFVRGESLRARLAHGGELPISEAVRTLREVASALAYAHENHVVHRDIKPENILISGGSAMVTDFGVAKAVSASSGAGVSPAGSLTSMGVALGTPSYMAPEQATADPNTDHRADIYALGVVAYEMLIGSTPFAGRSPPAMLAAHVTEAPEAVSRRRPGVPPLLAALVMKCLEKRPADRPQTAGDVVHELDALTTPSGGLAPTAALPAALGRNRFGRRAAIGAAAAVALLLLAAAGLRVRQSLAPGEAAAAVPAIAVLPFENRGSDERQEFTDGMTEEITNRLSSIRGLRVIGRQSSRAYAGSDKTPQEIAGELGVQYVLTGTVRWDRGADGREMVRVSPALLRTSDATQVWADAYQTVLSGMFEVQSKVATEVANALNVALLAPERDVLGAKPTENVEAYSLYLRGNELLTQEIEPYKIGQAIEALERSVAADSGFALAWARLSLAHTEYFWFYGDRSEDRLRKAKAAVDRALSLNPRLPEAHLALGAYHYHGSLDYNRALEQFSAAESGRPSDFEPIFFKAAVQRRQGKWRESATNMARAVELEPRVGAYTADYASTHFYLREYDAAERLVDRSLIVNPTLSVAHNLKAGIVIARDANLSGAVRIIRNRFDSEPDRALAANAVLAVPVVAAMDPVMRQAMIQVEWQPAFAEKTFFLLSKARLFNAIGDQGRARANADSAAAILISRVRERPDDADLHSSLALAQAFRGRKAEAIAAIERALTLRPLSKDAYGGADLLAMKADVLMLLEEEEAAISLFERLLAIPSGVSANQLWLLPDYASLRDNPRFRRLVNH